MRPVLDDPAAVKHEDFIAETAGRQPVADINRRFAGSHFAEFPIRFIFGDGVERSRRLIEHDERRMRIKRARQRNFLRFAAGNLNAVPVKVLIQAGRQTVWQFGEPFAETGFLQAAGHTGGIIVGAGRHVLPQ